MFKLLFAVILSISSTALAAGKEARFALKNEHSTSIYEEVSKKVEVDLPWGDTRVSLVWDMKCENRECTVAGIELNPELSNDILMSGGRTGTLLLSCLHPTTDTECYGEISYTSETIALDSNMATSIMDELIVENHLSPYMASDLWYFFPISCKDRACAVNVNGKEAKLNAELANDLIMKGVKTGEMFLRCNMQTAETICSADIRQ